MTAAVNLQLRFSPAMLALRALLERGDARELTDIDLHLVIEQPWHLWTFMIGAPRLELVYHSIHYLDAIRMIAGEPAGAYCKAVAHPETPQLRDTRSSIILDYGDHLRCSLVMNHTHRAGPRFKRSELMIEGTRGAARLVLGVNLDYPTGSPDEMEIFTRRAVAARAAARLVVYRGLRRADVEPAALHRRRGRRAGQPGRGHHQDDGADRRLLSLERSGRDTDPGLG